MNGLAAAASMWTTPVQALCCVLMALGCGEEATPMQRGMGLDEGSPAAAAHPGQTGEPAERQEGPASEPVVYRDEDFVESERNRDPFRTFASAIEAAHVPEASQRRVVMPAIAIESMRLIAIVSGTPKPRAMILDPMEVGHVVERGMYIGRAQVVQAPGNVPMALNWRVDRIRENEVVLTRQDPTHPNRPPLTRVMALNEELARR